MKKDLFRASVARLERHLPRTAQEAEIALDEVTSRYRRLHEAVADSTDLPRITDGAIEYRAPVDARHTALASRSVDLVFSNSVLEHVPAAAIVELFREARRMLADDGLMVHEINCSDHYAFVDKTVSKLNYLQYSDAAWAFWNNKFLYQNRLRAHEFMEMAHANGFEVLLHTAIPSERHLQELRALKVHPQFSCFTPEQLCVVSVDFVARKTAVGPSS